MSLGKKHLRHDRPLLTMAASILLKSILLICGSFAAVAGSSNQPLDNHSIVDLPPGGIGRDISAGEIQRFKVSLTENQLLRLFIEKGDLAITLTISDDAGRNLVERVGRGYGVMDVSVVANKTGSYRVEIHSLEAADQRHYEIRIKSVGEAT